MTAVRWALGRLGRRESGQTMLLGLGLSVLVLALVLVVASASAVYLDLKRLTALADSTAASAALEVGAGDYAQTVVGDGGGASPADVARGAAGALEAAPAPDSLEGVQVTSAGMVDSTTVVVTLSAHSRPPFLPWGIIPSQGFTIRATSTAQVRFEDP